jgi:hypothetical protein
MQALVYILCFIAACVCAGLLLHAYVRNRVRLLLWAALSFIALAINNFFVLADMILLPDVNLLGWRYAAALAAVCILIHGFIWDVE